MSHPATPPPARSDEVAAYLEGLAVGSRRAMRQALDRVAQVWLRNPAAIRSDARWPTLDADVLLRVRDVLLDAGAAPATATKLLSAAKGVARTAAEQGTMSAAQAAAVAAVPGLALSGPEPVAGRTLTAAEVHRLFESCARTDSPAHRRDAALLAVFLACGPRRAEVAALRTADWSHRRRRLRFAARDVRQHRVVELPAPAAAAVRHWLAVRGAEGPLFPAVAKGGRIDGAAVTDQAVYDRLRRIGSRAGVDDLTSRRLRRTCVVGLIAAGVPLGEVQRRLGHASWLTTAAYEALARDTREAVDLLRLPYRRPPRTPRGHDTKPRRPRSRRIPDAASGGHPQGSAQPPSP